MKKNNITNFKKRNSKILLYTLLFILIGVLIVVAGIVIHLFVKKNIVIQITIIVLFLLLIAGLFVEYYFIQQSYRMFYNDFYRITHINYAKLLNHEVVFSSYQDSFKFDEMKTLNDDIAKINKNLSRTTLVIDSAHYDDLKLVFIDENKRVVDGDSFHEYFREILMKSASYTNALLFIYYEFDKDGCLSDEQLNKMYDYLYNQFVEYSNFLLSPSRLKTGIYVYLPIIDSIDNIKEKCESMVKDLSLPAQGQEGGVISIPVQFALVCYPFSKIDEIFDDLHYAKRLGKMFNAYLPKRIDKVSYSRLIHHESLNLNIMSKILSSFLSIDNSTTEFSESLEKINMNLHEILVNFSIDECGIITFKDLQNRYEADSHLTLNEEYEDRFKKGTIFPDDFIHSLAEIAEDDNSYYASKRENLSSRIARLADKFSITSLFIYVVYGENKEIRGIVYFDNIDKEMPLNSYLKECLAIFSSKIGDYIITKIRQKELNDETTITNNILKLSNCFLYKIEYNTHKLTQLSDGWNDVNPEIKVGMVCHKALYGLDEPCEKCPLKTAKKMKTVINEYPVETSLTLNMNHDDAEKVLLVKRMKQNDDFTDDLFDQNYLINSYYSLIVQMKNAFLASSNGYLLLLKIDNRDELISKYGSEKLTQALRIFINKIKELENIDNIFYDKPDTFAIMMYKYGQNDVINEIESIYELSRTSCFEDKEKIFHFTYLPVSYPQGYATHKDFLKHVENFYFSKKYKSNEDSMYFDENGYSRSANKNDFMVSVIDSKFKNKKFQVNLQPILRTSDKRIVGAELLLRLTDDYRKIVFNTDQLIKAAADNGRIGLISDSLIEYIGTLYDEFGLNTFKLYGFERLSINTDYSYLKDPNLKEKLSKLIKEKHLPKGFLGFEIAEKEIFDHYNEMAKFIESIRDLDIILICDRYSGEYLTVDRLKKLGISEFKIDRPYTRFIDTDRNKYIMVKDLLDIAKSEGLKASLIGVENMEQFNMISELNKDSYVQGFYFFTPLEKDAFVEALRKNNTVLRIKK